MLKVTKVLLVFLFVAIISVVSLLFSGIKIDSFSFKNFKITQFYIKLDKKLIVDIKNLEYTSKKSKVKNSLDDIKKNIELLPKVLKIFQKININKLKIDGNEFVISLDEDKIYFDNKFINISSKLEFLSKQVIFDLESLHLKDVDVNFNGKIKLDYYNEKLNLFGKYKYQDITGNINVEANKDKADFYVNSEAFKSLKFIKKYVRLSPIAEAWMYDRVKGDIRLKEFYGTFDFNKNILVENSLRGKAEILKAKVKFHKNVDVINTQSIQVDFKKNRLSFDLVKPVYKGKKLDGSNVYIENLTSAKKGFVVVNIKTNTKLDKDVQAILKAFKINLPLTQKSGFTSANLDLKFPYDIKKSMSTNGKFVVNKANISINNFDFYTRKTTVYLKGSKVEIRNADFVHKKMIKANVDLDIDTRTLKAKGNALVKSFYIASKNDEIINIKNRKTPITMDFNSPFNIVLSKLKTKVTVKDRIDVKIDELSILYPYSKLLKEISVNSGSLNLSIKDENDILFSGFVSGFDYPIYKNDKKIYALNVNGKVLKNRVTVSSNDKNINVLINNNKLFLDLKNLMIKIDTKKEGSSKLTDLSSKLNNIKLKIDDDLYHVTRANVDINNQVVSFDGQVVNLNGLPIKKNKKEIKKLDVIGVVRGDEVSLNTKQKDLYLKIKNDKLNLSLNGYDLYLKTDSMDDEEEINEFNLKAKNSSIYVNEKFRFLANNYDIKVRKDSLFFNLNHKNTKLTYKEAKDGMVDIYANDVSAEYVNTIFDKKIISGGKLMLLAHGKKNELKGKLIVKNSKIEDLAIVNNLLLFIHTSPALLNPLLAIPSVVGAAANEGFNLTGYKITNGTVHFTYNKPKKSLAIDKLVTIGNGIDFDGKGHINLNDMSLKSKVKLIFFKDYSSIVGSIPVVNYVLLGKNKRVETEVDIFGPLNNPKISTNLTKDAFSIPLNIAKRILTSPVELIEFINESNKKKPKK